MCIYIYTHHHRFYFAFIGRSRARQIMITTPWLTSAHPVTQLILNPLSNEVCSHLSIVHVQIAETNPPSMSLRWPSFVFCAFHRYSWNT